MHNVEQQGLDDVREGVVMPRVHDKSVMRGGEVRPTSSCPYAVRWVVVLAGRWWVVVVVRCTVCEWVNGWGWLAGAGTPMSWLGRAVVWLVEGSATIASHLDQQIILPNRR